MSKSRSRKLREQEAKRLGYDVNALKRGDKIPVNKKTKTKKGKLYSLETKHRGHNRDDRDHDYAS